ncbi:hypothetical protein V8C86DRAFT_804723 [Haematococcus lacustris]
MEGIAPSGLENAAGATSGTAGPGSAAIPAPASTPAAAPASRNAPISACMKGQSSNPMGAPARGAPPARRSIAEIRLEVRERERIDRERDREIIMRERERDLRRELELRERQLAARDRVLWEREREAETLRSREMIREREIQIELEAARERELQLARQMLADREAAERELARARELAREREAAVERERVRERERAIVPQSLPGHAPRTAYASSNPQPSFPAYPPRAARDLRDLRDLDAGRSFTGGLIPLRSSVPPTQSRVLGAGPAAVADRRGSLPGGVSSANGLMLRSVDRRASMGPIPRTATASTSCLPAPSRNLPPSSSLDRSRLNPARPSSAPSRPPSFPPASSPLPPSSSTHRVDPHPSRSQPPRPTSLPSSRGPPPSSSRPTLPSPVARQSSARDPYPPRPPPPGSMGPPSLPPRSAGAMRGPLDWPPALRGAPPGLRPITAPPQLQDRGRGGAPSRSFPPAPSAPPFASDWVGAGPPHLSLARSGPDRDRPGGVTRDTTMSLEIQPRRGPPMAHHGPPPTRPLPLQVSRLPVPFPRGAAGPGFNPSRERPPDLSPPPSSKRTCMGGPPGQAPMRGAPSYPPASGGAGPRGAPNLPSPHQQQQQQQQQQQRGADRGPAPGPSQGGSRVPVGLGAAPSSSPRSTGPGAPQQTSGAWRGGPGTRAAATPQPSQPGSVGGGGGPARPAAAGGGATVARLPPASEQAWLYLDPEGQQQGPCSIAQFRNWLSTMEQRAELQEQLKQFQAAPVWLAAQPAAQPRRILHQLVKLYEGVVS